MPKSLFQNGAVRSALPLLLATLIIWAGELTAPAHAQTTKLNVAYTSTTTNFSIAWLAKLEGIFRKYNLDVELILMQGPSTYLPALLSGNIHILYGGGTAVSRAIAAADPNIVVIGTETRYVPLRLMVTPSVRTASDLKGKKLGVGRAGLDEYATLFYLDKNNLTPGKDVTLIYATGGILARAAQMKQGLYDGMAIPPPNEIELEKQGFRELAYFFDLRMAYAGIPYTVTARFPRQKPARADGFYDRDHRSDPACIAEVRRPATGPSSRSPGRTIPFFLRRLIEPTCSSMTQSRVYRFPGKKGSRA